MTAQPSQTTSVHRAPWLRIQTPLRAEASMRGLMRGRWHAARTFCLRIQTTRQTRYPRPRPPHLCRWPSRRPDARVRLAGRVTPRWLRSGCAAKSRPRSGRNTKRPKLRECRIRFVADGGWGGGEGEAFFLPRAARIISERSRITHTDGLSAGNTQVNRGATPVASAGSPSQFVCQIFIIK